MICGSRVDMVVRKPECRGGMGRYGSLLPLPNTRYSSSPSLISYHPSLFSIPSQPSGLFAHYKHPYHPINNQHFLDSSSLCLWGYSWEGIDGVVR